MRTAKTVPAKATSIEIVLDVILQIINVIRAIGELLFGANFTLFG